MDFWILAGAILFAGVGVLAVNWRCTQLEKRVKLLNLEFLLLKADLEIEDESWEKP